MESPYRLRKNSCTVRSARTILGLAIVLLMLFTLTNCEQAPQQVRLRTLSAREFYPLALKRAQQWKPDAYLTRVNADILLEKDPEHLRLSFYFESPSDDHHSLRVAFWEGSSVPETESIYHQFPIEVRNPIKSEDWPLDSVDVLPIIQENGGDEFLAEHDPELVNMTLHLERRPTVPGARLAWRGSYMDYWVTQDGLYIKLNPETGELIEVEWMPGY